MNESGSLCVNGLGWKYEMKLELLAISGGHSWVEKKAHMCNIREQRRNFFPLEAQVPWRVFLKNHEISLFPYCTLRFFNSFVLVFFIFHAKTVVRASKVSYFFCQWASLPFPPLPPAGIFQLYPNFQGRRITIAAATIWS